MATAQSECEQAAFSLGGVREPGASALARRESVVAWDTDLSQRARFHSEATAELFCSLELDSQASADVVELGYRHKDSAILEEAVHPEGHPQSRGCAARKG